MKFVWDAAKNSSNQAIFAQSPEYAVLCIFGDMLSLGIRGVCFHKSAVFLYKSVAYREIAFQHTLHIIASLEWFQNRRMSGCVWSTSRDRQPLQSITQDWPTPISINSPPVCRNAVI